MVLVVVAVVVVVVFMLTNVGEEPEANNSGDAI